MNNIKYETITIRCRDLNNYDESEINKDLLDAHWESVYNTESPNKAWFAMHSILKGTIDRHAPFISKRIKGKPSPWITDKLKKEMNARDKLMRKARKTKNELDWDSYRRKRNFVNNEIKRSKRTYYKIKLQENANKPEKFWKFIKEIFPTKSKEDKTPKTFKINNEPVTEKPTIANEFCKFFSRVANNLKSKAFPFNNFIWRPKPITENSAEHQFNFRTVTDHEVLKHLKNLKRKSAVGLNDIPPFFIKDIAYVISKPLTHVINYSLRTGSVRGAFKGAKVTPIFKSVPRDDFDNYRLISVLPIISKILERCVHVQIMEYLESHELLSTYQFGFRKKDLPN